METRRDTVPIIFQVLSSRASFFRSTFSSLSALNLSGAGLGVFSLGGISPFSVFSGFSAAALGVVDFFSLLAIESKIMIWTMKCRPRARLIQNKHYFLIIPVNRNAQPKINKRPPTGVAIPIRVGTVLFMA